MPSSTLASGKQTSPAGIELRRAYDYRHNLMCLWSMGRSKKVTSYARRSSYDLDNSNARRNLHWS
jgi:hypothetical protein